MKLLCYIPDALLSIVVIGGVYHGSNAMGVSAIICCSCLVGSRVFASYKQRQVEVVSKEETTEIKNKINALMIRAGMKQ